MTKVDFCNLLMCPKCKETITNSLHESDIIFCVCGNKYSIINDVPDFLDPKGKDFSKKNLSEINKTFSNQWSMFKYQNKYKTWDWNIRTRIHLFFKEMNIKPLDMKGKFILDAGCGNGVLTALLTRFGCNSFGVDISDSVFRASYECKSLSSPNNPVRYTKGSLTNPPFSDKSFDYIYSSGVLHHNKNTKDALKSVLPLLKEDGRIYVWLYRKRIIQQLYAEPLRNFVLHLPPELMSGFTYLLSYPFQLMRKLNNLFRGRKYVHYSIDELQLSLHDTFSPNYVNQHDEQELLDWFNEFGFIHSKVTKRDRHGFGIVASMTNI